MRVGCDEMGLNQWQIHELSVTNGGSSVRRLGVHKMSLIVQKFGGSSVANAQRVFNVANIITDTYDKGNDVIVVVSAQGDTTDDLIAKAAEINPNPSKREMDMLLSTGEQISIALLAMAIEKLGYPVISLTGPQAGFVTDSNYSKARIRRIEKKNGLKMRLTTQYYHRCRFSGHEPL